MSEDELRALSAAGVHCHGTRWASTDFGGALPPLHASHESHWDPLTRRIATCYQRVYGTDLAWNEGKKCERCSTDAAPRKWNFDAPPPDQCPDCGTPLVDHWPVEGIIADMQHELSYPGAVCAIAMHGVEVIGACWGFVVTPESLEAHCRLSGLARTLREQFPETERYAYQDEIFVLREYHGTGVGSELFTRRHRHFCALLDPPTRYVMRTKRNPPSRSYQWFTKPRWGYSVVAMYHDADDRVILSQRFDRIPVPVGEYVRRRIHGPEVVLVP